MPTESVFAGDRRRCLESSAVTFDPGAAVADGGKPGGGSRVAGLRCIRPPSGRRSNYAVATLPERRRRGDDGRRRRSASAASDVGSKAVDGRPPPQRSRSCSRPERRLGVPV